MLAVVTGPMFAGKSTHLVEAALDAPKGFLAFRPSRDTRTHELAIKTHTGVSIPCRVVGTSNDVFSLAKVCDPETQIFIDEVQFFDRGIVDAALALSRRGHLVICAGLCQDYLGAPFGSTHELLVLADQAIKLVTECPECECGVASRTYRISEASQQVQVGGSAEYKALCDACYVRNMDARGLDYVGKTYRPNGLRLISPI